MDAELKSIGDKARDLKSRKVQQLGELVIAVGADTLRANELAGALILLADTKDAGRRWHGPSEGPRSFKDGRGEMPQRIRTVSSASPTLRITGAG